MVTVLGKEDVKPFLNMAQTDNDSLVESVLAQAEGYVVTRCGPLASTALTKTVRMGGGNTLRLPVIPAISITSVTGVESGYAYTLDDDEDINLRAGLIELDTASDEVFTVVYQAGWSPLPEDLKRAVVEVCRYLWRPQRGSGARGGDADQMASLRLAEMLMAPYMLPGFA